MVKLGSIRRLSPREPGVRCLRYRNRFSSIHPIISSNEIHTGPESPSHVQRLLSSVRSRQLADMGFLRHLGVLACITLATYPLLAEHPLSSLQFRNSGIVRRDVQFR